MQYLYQEEDGGRKRFSNGSRFTMYAIATNRESWSNQCPHIDFHVPEGWWGNYLPNRDVLLRDLPFETQRTIIIWVKKVNYFRSLRRDLWKRLQALLGRPANAIQRTLHPYRCNTPGQIMRVWPELQPFFPREWKGAVRESSVRSPVPRIGLGIQHQQTGVNLETVTGEQFRGECKSVDPRIADRFRRINEVLAMMAVAEGSVEAPQHYPSVGGPTDWPDYHLLFLEPENT